jgi:hypothetical protein
VCVCVLTMKGLALRVRCDFRRMQKRMAKKRRHKGTVSYMKVRSSEHAVKPRYGKNTYANDQLDVDATAVIVGN